MYDGPIIDSDVHHARKSDRDIYDYLPKKWQEFASLPEDGSLVPFAAPMMIVSPTTVPRTFSPTGAGQSLRVHGAGNYDAVREDLLDRYTNIELAMLNPAGGPSAHPNGEFAHAICRAVNEWTRDVWLDGTGDRRLLASVQVPMHVPELAAEEIRRAGQDDRFVSVFLSHNSLGKPLGHPIYHPIFEAAAEMDLPIMTHVNGGEYMGSSANFLGGGDSHQCQIDVSMGSYQSTASHLTSLIVHGVFEKYPSLRCLMAEPGVSWLVWLVGRLESNWELLRAESSWVRKHPLEYIHDSCAVTTQPCEATLQTKRNFVENLRLVEGIEDILCYSSDYPHRDADWPPYIASILPKAWHRKVFYDNAQRVLRIQHSESGQRTDPVALPA